MLHIQNGAQEFTQTHFLVCWGNHYSRYWKKNRLNLCWASSRSDHERDRLSSKLNGWAFEQWVNQRTVDSYFYGTQDLVRDVNVTEFWGNSDHPAICFNMCVRRSKSNTKNLDFQRETSLRWDLIRKKLKGKVKSPISPVYMEPAHCKNRPQRKKSLTKPWRGQYGCHAESIKGKETSFHKWKTCPNENKYFQIC